MTGIEVITTETELVPEEAERDIVKAVSARHAIARKYVTRLRRRHPEATPAEVITMLERHYGTSITTAGALISAGSIAADVGIALIPIAGPAAAGMKSAGQQAAKKAGSEAAKIAAKEASKAAAKAAMKGVALGAAKSGAQRAATLLPAGDEQLQFEITAVFALALADIHSMNLDQEQAHALVYGLSNGRVSQQQIATMAADLAEASPEGSASIGRSIAAGRGDWAHWANTLADTLPGGTAQSLVRTIQTGRLDTVRENLSGKQQATIEYGVGALAGGVTRFLFGRDVIAASRTAFAEAPDEFPSHLAIQVKVQPGDDGEVEQNRALMALEEAAMTTGTWIADAASAVGTGVSTGTRAVGTGIANGAESATRVFRSVDIDGDGIPDEPQALSKAKDVGGAIAGAAGSAGRGVAGLFKSKIR